MLWADVMFRADLERDAQTPEHRHVPKWDSLIRGPVAPHGIFSTSKGYDPTPLLQIFFYARLEIGFNIHRKTPRSTEIIKALVDRLAATI